MCIIAITERERERKRTEQKKIFEGVVSKSFLKLITDKKSLIKLTQNTKQDKH
jgi:hypothetical protein